MKKKVPSFRSFRVRLKDRLKISLFQTKQVGQKLIRKTINILIIIKREAKKIIVYVLCVVAATRIGSQSSAYMRKSEVDQLPM